MDTLRGSLKPVEARNRRGTTDDVDYIFRVFTGLYGPRKSIQNLDNEVSRVQKAYWLDVICTMTTEEIRKAMDIIMSAKVEKYTDNPPNPLQFKALGMINRPKHTENNVDNRAVVINDDFEKKLNEDKARAKANNPDIFHQMKVTNSAREKMLLWNMAVYGGTDTMPTGLKKWIEKIAKLIEKENE